MTMEKERERETREGEYKVINNYPICKSKSVFVFLSELISFIYACHTYFGVIILYRIIDRRKKYNTEHMCVCVYLSLNNVSANSY